MAYYILYILSPVSDVQAWGGRHGVARALRCRGQVLHGVASAPEGRADHPGELPQPGHPGYRPPPGETDWPLTYNPWALYYTQRLVARTVAESQRARKDNFERCGSLRLLHLTVLKTSHCMRFSECVWGQAMYLFLTSLLCYLCFLNSSQLYK